MSDVVSGCAFLDKPPGITSFAALYSVKRAFATLRVGHTGTLDPFASGLLVAMVGRATRAAQFVVGLDKTYIARFEFGTETDTDDSTGKPTRTEPIPSHSEVRAALPSFVGSLCQVPPAFSAVHVGGKRAYELARAGQKPELSSRSVVVREFTELSWDGCGFEALVSCSSGTYIRSLARDLGRKVGSAAHLSELRRTRIGPFCVEDAVSPDSITRQDLRDVGEALMQIPRSCALEVTQIQAERIRHGVELRKEEVEEQLMPPAQEDVGRGPVDLVIIRLEGRTIAIASWNGERLTYHGVFEAGTRRD